MARCWETPDTQEDDSRQNDKSEIEEPRAENSKMHKPKNEESKMDKSTKSEEMKTQTRQTDTEDRQITFLDRSLAAGTNRLTDACSYPGNIYRNNSNFLRHDSVCVTRLWETIRWLPNLLECNPTNVEQSHVRGAVLWQKEAPLIIKQYLLLPARHLPWELTIL